MNFIRRLAHGDAHIDFIGKRKIWFALSGVLLLVTLLALPLWPAESSCSPPLPSFFGGLNCGIEFKGGISIQAPIQEDSELADLDELDVIAEVRGALEPLGAEDAQIQIATEDEQRNVIVQTTAVGETETQEEVATVVREITGAEIADSPTQRIGRRWGGEITSKAIQALVIFLLVIVAFMSWRFEWKMAVGAFAALFHDLIITAGVYAISGFEVTPSTVIAILTILGYSLYDNVVVFDKVEENAALYATTGKMTYEGAANLALNQVFMRSLNTSVTTLIPVAALLIVGAGIVGGGTLNDLSLALFVGLMVGTYSSVFVATPVLSMLKEREQRFQSVREKLLRDVKRSQTKASAAAPPVEGGDGAAPSAPASPVAVGTKVPQTTRPPARAKAGSKKAKRRKKR